jgi:hypothetical protein
MREDTKKRGESMSKPTIVKGEKVAEVVKDPKLLADIDRRMASHHVVDRQWLTSLIGSEKVAQLVNQKPEVLTVNYDVELAAQHMNKINAERIKPHHEPAPLQRQVEHTPLQRWRKSHE